MMMMMMMMMMVDDEARDWPAVKTTTLTFTMMILEWITKLDKSMQCNCNATLWYDAIDDQVRVDKDLHHK